MNTQLRLFAGQLDSLGRQRRARGQCHDCALDVIRAGEMFMVRDDAWPLATYAGYLCVECIEHHLDRRLTPADFTHVPSNQHDGHSARLRDRLGHTTITHPETPTFLTHS